MAKTLALTAIVLLTAACTDSGEYRDGGSVLVVGEDISADRAATLVATGFAVSHASVDLATDAAADADAAAAEPSKG